MRILTDEEMKVFFTKLADYIGPNIKYLIDRSDETYVFRLLKNKVYYMSENIMKFASNIGRDELFQLLLLLLFWELNYFFLIYQN